MSEKPEKQAPRHPWRENIEAITMAIVMAVMLKYFIVEAYKIPTGSMQPTLMGNDETNIKDRILVDKFSYHFRKPKRFEVTVFKYPLDLSKNFIKRMVGVGPEQLKIENGDLWNRPDGTQPWQVLRKPRPVQLETWKELHPGMGGLPGWKALGGASSWSTLEDSIDASGTGSLRFPPSGSVMDNYRDGYPLAVRKEIRSNRLSARHPVGDLRVTGEITARAGCESVTVELREGSRRYRFEFPGPGADQQARLGISAKEAVRTSSSALGAGCETVASDAWRLGAGDTTSFAVQNLDDVLQLEVDGEIVLELEIPAASDQMSCVFLHLKGAGAELEDLMVYRDIYYLSDSVKRAEWDIPADHFVMLGDNTQDSSDAREWMLERIRYPRGEGGTIYRGNLRTHNINPRRVQGGPEGTVLWFRDEFGELHHWPAAETERLTPMAVSLVPRELVTGRAVLVFWPFKLSFGLWRLEWVH
ncbi:MAG: signal peptidase I [bacterium]|jgi:signal peptidase I|nr:signal peptidase I [Planctomycetota bacterium]HIL52709.1 signal peptidase I [Planctomycetota bacterium]